MQEVLPSQEEGWTAVRMVNTDIGMRPCPDRPGKKYLSPEEPVLDLGELGKFHGHRIVYGSFFCL